MHRAVELTYRVAKRVVIAIIGTTVVLLGVAMLVLPGPGILTIILGLMLLGVEFAFARSWLVRIKSTSQKAAGRVRAKIRSNDPPRPPELPDKTVP